MSPKQSLYRGQIGSDGALPLSKDIRAYFEQRGVQIEGRLFEDLEEAELLEALKTVSAWLPAEDRQVLEETAAFGLSSTNEPNACAMRCPDGYAILFDSSFQNLLSRAIELYCSFLLPPITLSTYEFPLALNTSVVCDFFHVADPSRCSAYKLKEGFAHRKFTDKALWLLILFLLAHETGHIC
jgi:hypothetical protein